MKKKQFAQLKFAAQVSGGLLSANLVLILVLLCMNSCGGGSRANPDLPSVETKYDLPECNLRSKGEMEWVASEAAIYLCDYGYTWGKP